MQKSHNPGPCQTKDIRLRVQNANFLLARSTQVLFCFAVGLTQAIFFLIHAFSALSMQPNILISEFLKFMNANIIYTH